MTLRQGKRLVTQFNQGDIHALQVMYDQFKGEMVTLAMGLLFDRALAEDVLHEVFTKLIRMQGRFRVQKSLRTYLLKAVANEARTMNRARSKQSLVTDDLLKQTGTEMPIQFAIQGEQRNRLAESLAKLPYEQREVLLLRHVAQITFRAIAKQQAVSLSAARARYRYGLHKLRSLLGDEL